jgi:hypothetical protein
METKEVGNKFNDGDMWTAKLEGMFYYWQTSGRLRDWQLHNSVSETRYKGWVLQTNTQYSVKYNTVNKCH